MQSSKVLPPYSSPVDCGSPCNPRNGSVTSFTGTTNGSIAFYSCDLGLVPVMEMRAVCTGNGWSPNPADLNCSVGMLLMVTRTCQGTHVCVIEIAIFLQMSTRPLDEIVCTTHTNLPCSLHYFVALQYIVCVF